MGKEVRGIPEAASLGAPEAVAASVGRVGRYLAGQRRLRGISLDELSATTRIPRRSLERLEGGAFDGQADGFARGFVRTVAVALGLDPEEAVNCLLADSPALRPASGRPGRFLQSAALVGGIAVALAVGAAVAFWMIREPRAGFEKTPVEAPAVVFRRDAVRALAEDARAAGGNPEEAPARNAAPRE